MYFKRHLHYIDTSLIVSLPIGEDEPNSLFLFFLCVIVWLRLKQPHVGLVVCLISSPTPSPTLEIALIVFPTTIVLMLFPDQPFGEIWLMS